MSQEKLNLIQSIHNLLNDYMQKRIQEEHSKIGIIRILPNGNIFIFDKEDEWKILSYNWYENKNGYAARQAYINEKNIYGKSILMHRWILGLTKDDKIEVDHINNIKWDNRKENLRLSTNQGNSQNQLLQRNNTSGFKGVKHIINTRISNNIIIDKHYWRASIYINGKGFHRNFPYTNEGLIEASKYYDIMAIKYHKQFAKTNQMIYNEYPRILQQFNMLIFNEDKNLSIHNLTTNQFNYQYISLFHEIRKSQINNITEDYFSWKAFIVRNNKVILRKLFPHTNAGLILAAEAVNKKLIEIGENPVNKIDYSICSAEEFVQTKLALQGTSQYLGVSKYIRKHTQVDGTITQALFWVAVVTHNNKVISKQFDFSIKGEQEAALYYNEKAQLIFGNKAKLNIIDDQKAYKYFEEDLHEIFISNLIAQNPRYNNQYIGLQKIERIYKKRNGQNAILKYWRGVLYYKTKNIFDIKYPQTPTGMILVLREINKKLEKIGAFELLNDIDEFEFNQEEADQILLINVNHWTYKEKAKNNKLIINQYWTTVVTHKNKTIKILFPYTDLGKEQAKLAANILREKINKTQKLNIIDEFLLTQEDINYVYDKVKPCLDKLN